MNISVPQDGRAQYDPATVWTVNAMAGRWITAGVETMTPGGKYILANSCPKPPPTNSNFSSAVAASQPAPATAPRSSAAARAIWPNLR